LSEAVRIPCYKGLELVHLTYRGFVRQIREVLQVAMTHSSYAGKLLPTLASNRYRYLTALPVSA
jgi:hypothetical protein